MNVENEFCDRKCYRFPKFLALMGGKILLVIDFLGSY